jgi:hypothetical protein
MKNKKFIDYKSENNNKLIKKNDVIPGIKISQNDHKQNYVKMIENINEKLAIENQLLSDENLKLRKAFSELLNDYLAVMQNKCPDNLIIAGRKYFENKIN